MTKSILICVVFLSLFFYTSIAWAELQPGETLGQENWQEAKGLLPEAVLRRFEDGSYQAKITTLPNTLGWGSKFTAASEANTGKFAIDTTDSLIVNDTKTYPAFLYGYPFPQIDPKDPQAAAKVMYNFSYTLMQADDAQRFSTLHWVSAAALVRQVEFRGRLLFQGSRASGPLANPDATLRKGIIAGVAPVTVYGAVILEWVYLDSQQWNSLWAYIPEFKRMRKLPPADGSESLFGSDLAHDDLYLFSGKVQYFTWKLLGVQDALVPSTLPNPKPLRRAEQGYLLEMPADLLGMGWEKKGWKGKAWWPTNCQLIKRPVWVVEATAKDAQYAYGRQVLWIDKELYVAYYKEAYNRAGKLWRMLLNSVTVARTPEGDLSLAQPDFTLSVDEELNRATVELPSKQEEPLTFGVGLSDELFTPANLLKRGK
ncbi:MAG: DUF1329 domain-containing protein [Candidatus Binatia bacterium]